MSKPDPDQIIGLYTTHNFSPPQKFSEAYNYIIKTPNVSNIFDIPQHFSSIVVVLQHPLANAE